MPGIPNGNKPKLKSKPARGARVAKNKAKKGKSKKA